MAEKSKSGNRAVLFGCLGCSGALGLAVLAFVAFIALNWGNIQEHSKEERAKAKTQLSELNDTLHQANSSLGDWSMPMDDKPCPASLGVADEQILFIASGQLQAFGPSGYERRKDQTIYSWNKDLLALFEKLGDKSEPDEYLSINDIMDRLSNKEYAVVTHIDRIERPLLMEDGFKGGYAVGAVFLVDLKEPKRLCHHRFQAESSDQVSSGGGVGIRVKGVPLGKVGKKDAQQAIEEDFNKNVTAARADAVAKL